MLRGRGNRRIVACFRILDLRIVARHSVPTHRRCHNPRVAKWVAALPWPPLVLTAGVVAFAIAAVFVPHSGASATTNASISSTARTADLLAGLGLLAAGLIAFTEPRARRVGLLSLLAGVAWFGPDWEGWDGGPGLARSLGAVAAPLLLALVFHLACVHPGTAQPARREEAR